MVVVKKLTKKPQNLMGWDYSFNSFSGNKISSSRYFWKHDY